MLLGSCKSMPGLLVAVGEAVAVAAAMALVQVLRAARARAVLSTACVHGAVCARPLLGGCWYLTQPPTSLRAIS